MERNALEQSFAKYDFGKNAGSDFGNVLWIKCKNGVDLMRLLWSKFQQTDKRIEKPTTKM